MNKVDFQLAVIGCGMVSGAMMVGFIAACLGAILWDVVHG